MAVPFVPRAPGRRSLLLALGQLVLFGAGLTAIVIALLPAGGEAPLWSLVVYALVGPAYLAAGVVAWWRRPSGRIGALLCWCGAAFLASAMGNVTVPVLAAVGVAAAELPIGVMIHLLLAFPTGRLPDRWSRGLVVAGYATTVVLYAPQYLAERPEVVALARTVTSAAGFVVITLAALVVVRRLRAADAAQRKVLAAVSGYGVFAILFLTLSAIVTRVAGWDPVALFVAKVLVVVGLPLAFLAGVVRGRFARTADVEELGVWLGTADGARPALRDAFAATLGDPSLELLFWLPEEGRYVDAVGAPGPGWLQQGDTADVQWQECHPAAIPGRAHVTVHVGGERVGAIVYDAASLPDPELVRAAGRIVALAVERERLTAQLLAGRAALRESRARIVESADQERRRIARDLHDGLQAQLVVLALRAGQLPEGARLRAGVESAIVALRDLVHGILPALLVQRGLYAATAELLDQLPIPSRLSCPTEDAPPLPASVESAGYFTVAEALTNAVKHAAASHLVVRLARSAAALTIEVTDDGVGGVEPAGGLRGIADRVEALGGRLHVDSPPGRGTRLVAELPCAS